MGIYTTPLHCYPLLSDMIKIPTEQVKFKECQVMTMILIDYYSDEEVPNAIIFNTEIEKQFEGVFLSYKKAKQMELLVQSYLRLSKYYSLFKEKEKECLELLQRAYMECIRFNSKKKVKILLQCYLLLHELGYRRKGCLYLYLAIASCYESPQDLLSIIPHLFREMNKTFPVYDLYENQITSYEIFKAIHDEVSVHEWKKISFEECLRDTSAQTELKRVNKKRIEKEYYLKVKNNLMQYDHLLPGSRTMIEVKWPSILYNSYLNLLIYYKGINNAKMSIVYTIGLLQFLRGFLSQNEQINLFKEHSKYSLSLQEKLYLNLPYLPIVIKVIPIKGRIKLEKKNKFSIEGINKKCFLFNPWEKTYGVSCFWTVNSLQSILIKLFNPLSIPLTLTRISLVFEGQIPFSYPLSTILDPNSSKDVLFTIRPSREGLTSIKGINYEIENTVGRQFVDSNGNGILFHTENLSNDAYSLSLNKREMISLENIQIYPEIPLLNLQVINATDTQSINEPLELFEYQYHPFSFLIENISNYPIEAIDVCIYAYKKDDYKVVIDEISLGKDNNGKCLIESKCDYIFNYNYIHRKKHKKVEFRFYYKFNSELYESMAMKPFCYYTRKLTLKRLFIFSNLKSAPMLNTNSLRDIIKNDSRIKTGYSYAFSTLKYYLSFDMQLLFDNTSIKYNITNGENLIKKGSITGSKPTEISLVAKDINRLSDIDLNWELINNSTQQEATAGTIDLYRLIINELEYKFYEGIVFDIIIKEICNEEGVKCLEVIHRIKNKSKVTYSNLRLYIYLFHENEGMLVFNICSNPNFFYEGSLFHLINQFNPSEQLDYRLTVYPPEGEIIDSTCALIDDKYRIIYIPSIEKRFGLNHTEKVKDALYN